ncbi:MAG: hypothetical protein NZ741_13440, partial [Armatimonadetes bacterium]|nr:hypothetical protein [Armatimonadota bacterium]
ALVEQQKPHVHFARAPEMGRLCCTGKPSGSDESAGELPAIQKHSRASLPASPVRSAGFSLLEWEGEAPTKSG